MPAPKNAPQNNEKQAVVRRVSFPMIAGQVMLVAILTFVIEATLRPNNLWESGTIALVVFFTYFQVGRGFLLAAHRRGQTLSKQKQFKEAIVSFERDYAFLSRKPWIDDYRWLVLLSPSQIGYREMDLYNIAYCYVQMNRPHDALRYYKRLVAEFAGSPLANAAAQVVQQSQTVMRQQPSGFLPPMPKHRKR